jgi:hypothetical protein
MKHSSPLPAPPPLGRVKRQQRFPSAVPLKQAAPPQPGRGPVGRAPRDVSGQHANCESVNDAHTAGDLVDPEDIVGVAEIAEMAGVSTAAVANWRARGPGFPEPLFAKRAGRFFSRRAVLRWLKHRRNKRTRKEKTMAKVIATINLKGGVTRRPQPSV